MLIDRLKKRLVKDRPQTTVTIRITIDVVDAMKQGSRVELRGFGAFSVKERDGRTGRNPRTGESVDVTPKRVPFFKTGKELRVRLNKKG